MSDQGARAQRRSDDGWWHAVYQGPAGTLPDTPDAVPGAGSVDDWFESAAGMIGAQRTAEPAAPARVPDTRPAPEPRPEAQPEARPEPQHPAHSLLKPVPEPEPEPAPQAEPAPRPVPAPEPAPEPADRTEPSEQSEQSVRPEPTERPRPAEPVQPLRRPRPEPPVPHVGDRPPTYGPEPTALPAAEPATLATLVPDTALDGAQYGPSTLRAASVRGDSARYRGEPRRDALLVTRFGEGEDGLLLAVLAAPGRRESAEAGAGSAAEAARRLAAAIGRSRSELVADLRAGARDRLRYGLQRLTVLAAGPLTTVVDGAEPGDAPDGAPAQETDLGSLHCLLVPLDPAAGHRAAFGTGPGALYLLRSGHWIDAYAARLLHHPDGQPPLPAAPAVPPRPFRFRLVPATAGDILLLCTPGLAEPIAQEPAVAHFLSNHWAHPHPPGTVDFLRQVQVRAKGYADDRTAIALWTE
ncbi:protein phosphatase 2C domain-containing protein [Kitasatospora sp. NPDC094015]|uniref:protein phosphatase 2C domain-containing protein n=1 Tax=Kitasatospora sp. NPDC094015 TaxID=3155205 RepID=UPI0033205C05